MAVATAGVSSPPGSSGATARSPGLAKRTSYQYSQDVMKPLPGKQPPSRTGFLVSFLVDARGGAMTGHRHWGMRVIIPPGALNQPTRVNCKYQMVQALASPPPLNEREALASRVIEISPAGQKFSAPVLLEIPHFASHSRAERETVVIRSDDGTTWREHISEPVEDGEIYQDVVESVVLDNSHLERIYDVLEVNRGRVVRILTSHFPKYFAVISRVREDSATVGREGGKVTLLQDTKLRATFSKDALNRPIRVGLQVQTIRPELVQATFGRSVEVSKMVSVEPRFRKFHQPIFVSIPLPCAERNANNIRLLCSITGEDKKAQWQDMTGTTALEINQDIVHFSTKISAIFWILVIYDKQRDPASALSLASRLYEESILAPYMARISVFYRENFPRAWVTTLRIYCMTDDKAEKVISSLHGFQPLAFSGDIEITNTSSVAVKVKGNLVQVRQDPFNGEMLTVTTLRNPDIKGTFVFKAFEENSLTLLVKPKEVGTPIEGKMNFFRKLTSINDTQQVPICELNFNAAEGAIGGENKAGCENGESPDVQQEEPSKHNDTPIRQIFKEMETTEEPAKKKSGNDVEEDPYEIIERKTLADIHPNNDFESKICAPVTVEEHKDPMEPTKEQEAENESEDAVSPKEEILSPAIITEDTGINKKEFLEDTDNLKRSTEIVTDYTTIDEEEKQDDNENLKRFETIKIEPMNKVDQHEQMLDDLGNDKKTLREFKKEFYVEGDGLVGKTQEPENNEEYECKTVTEPHISTSIKQSEQQIVQETIIEEKGNHNEIRIQSREIDKNQTPTKTMYYEQPTTQQKVQKEKKKSFVQEWKRDLKDFFTIKKKSTSSSNISHQELTKSPQKLQTSKDFYNNAPQAYSQRSSSIKRKSIQEEPTCKTQSKDSSQEYPSGGALEPQQFSTSMVAHMHMPLEVEEKDGYWEMLLKPGKLDLDPEMKPENEFQKDIYTTQKHIEIVIEEDLDSIKKNSAEHLDENEKEDNLNTELNEKQSVEKDTALREDVMSCELDDLNDTESELIIQHNDIDTHGNKDNSYWEISLKPGKLDLDPELKPENVRQMGIYSTQKQIENIKEEDLDSIKQNLAANLDENLKVGNLDKKLNKKQLVENDTTLIEDVISNELDAHNDTKSEITIQHNDIDRNEEKDHSYWEMSLKPGKLDLDSEMKPENDRQMGICSTQKQIKNDKQEDLDSIKQKSAKHLDENVKEVNLDKELNKEQLVEKETALIEDVISHELDAHKDNHTDLANQHNDIDKNEDKENSYFWEMSLKPGKLDLDPLQVEQIDLPLEPKGLDVDLEMNATNESENDVHIDIHSNEKEMINLTGEDLNSIKPNNDVEKNEVKDSSYFTTSMITHCITDNHEVIETTKEKHKSEFTENGLGNSSLTLPIENDKDDDKPVFMSTENDDKDSLWLKNKMLPINEQTGKYCLPQEPKGTTENWISNWIVDEKEEAKKKDNKSGFLTDVKRFFRPSKKSKSSNSTVTNSQTLRPQHQTSITKPKVTHSLPTTPEFPQKSSTQPEPTNRRSTPERKTSRNITQPEPTDQDAMHSIPTSQSTSPVRTPQSEKKFSPHGSLIQYDVQKVLPGSIVDDLISNMLQEPEPIQDCGTGMDGTGGTNENGNCANQMLDEDWSKEQSEDFQKSKRPARSKRSSRRKTNHTASTSKTEDEDINKDIQNDHQVSKSLVNINNQSNERAEEIPSNPPPEIASTRRKKKRKTNEDHEKEQERSMLYPNEKKLIEEAKARPVLKKQDSTSSCGEKPKIVVAAPRGIPRPRRRKKDGTLEPEYRDRDASVDSYSEKPIEGLIMKRKSRQSSIVEMEELNSANGANTIVNPFSEEALVVNNKSFFDQFVNNSINEAIKCSISCEKALNKESEDLKGKNIVEGDNEDSTKQMKNSQRCSDETTQQLQGNSQNVINSQEFNKAADSFDDIFMEEERKVNTKEAVNENLQLESNLLGNVSFSNNDYSEKASLKIDVPEDGENCTIDPEYLKNIDGPAHQRKGFTRFQKRQNSKDKHKSPSRVTSDDEYHGSEEEENMNLSTKLEETNVQMKRVEEAFNVISKEEDGMENIVITQTITTETVIEEPWAEQTESNARITMRDIKEHREEFEQIPTGGGLVSPVMVMELESSSSKTEMD